MTAGSISGSWSHLTRRAVWFGSFQVQVKSKSAPRPWTAMMLGPGGVSGSTEGRRSNALDFGFSALVHFHQGRLVRRGL